MRPAPPHLPSRLSAPASILEVWRSFDGVPMETLTKAWVYCHRGPGQRSVAMMEADRARTGASGNCFDLAIWLRHRLRRAGIGATIIGHALGTREAHVAVLAEDAEGRPYLCDLGDMWLWPVAVDVAQPEPVSGFFPAADVSLNLTGPHLQVDYFRPGEKMSAQRYDLRPVADTVLREAAELNQRNLAQLLVEVRAPEQGAHWEFTGHSSHWSTPMGIRREPGLAEDLAWGQRIAARTGIRADYAAACIDAFRLHAG